MSLDGAPSFSDLRTPEDLTGLDLDSEVENRIQALRARGRAEAQAAYKAADALKAFGRTDLANKVVLAVPVDFITERRSLRHRRDTAFGSSFAAAMGSYRQVTKHLTELHGRKAVQSVFQKVQGPQLATQLGLKVAERYQTNVRFQDLDPAPGSIIKPTADSGSQGVIIYGHDGTLKNLLSKEPIQTSLQPWHGFVVRWTTAKSAHAVFTWRSSWSARMEISHTTSSSIRSMVNLALHLR